MQESRNRTVRLKDYRPPPFLVDEVSLQFDLTEENVCVINRMILRRNPDSPGNQDALRLDGAGLDLKKVKLDGRALQKHAYCVDDSHLLVPQVPDVFCLETEVHIRPGDNTLLEGLYRSGGIFCTQCEAEGFRRITFFPDRPDVMTTFTTTIVADRSKYPVLLSNGNLVEAEVLENGRHRVVWHDPFPKPSYLFALVAGDLAVEEDFFITRSGREVKLQVYLERHNHGRGAHALRALKKAMRWEEEVFGLEYDLGLYMIVAVDDFNMGAMENKGLNIFNSKYVLADFETATDADFQAIEEVVAHEYFHNWTGNRVTCRDWFQLSLKEGLTVFRDQEFSADMVAKSLKRIHDVRMLRTMQFAEDAGPLAHPVRPEEYQEINNFYTVTVYEKGAEIVRMLQNLVGAERFREGLKLYFERFDGQAVTIEDFVKVMEDVAHIDLTQFRLWYSQAGTPCITASGTYDSQTKEYILKLSQECSPTPGQAEKLPFHIPVSVGLLDASAKEIPFCQEGQTKNPPRTTTVLSLREKEQEFRFSNIPSQPVPSLLRGFSAPVRLKYAYSDAELRFLMVHDRDSFNRWDAAQQLATRIILRGVDLLKDGEDLQLDPLLLKAFRETLEASASDRGLAAQMLSLPSENYLCDQRRRIDIDGICLVRQKVRQSLGLQLQELWHSVWCDCSAGDTSGRFKLTSEEIARRSLKNTCLGYLSAASGEDFLPTAGKLLAEAPNMTDRLALAAIMAEYETEESRAGLMAFYRQAAGNSLVLDKWFALQASARHPSIVQKVQSLLEHKDFNLRNPNRVRAVLHTFARGNPGGFHALDGSGYRLVADYVVMLDKLNPQVSASLAGAFSAWRRFDDVRRHLMEEQLQKISGLDGISIDLREIVSRCLQPGEQRSI